MLSNFLRNTSLGKGVTERYLRYKKQSNPFNLPFSLSEIHLSYFSFKFQSPWPIIVFNVPKKSSAESMLKNQKINVERKASDMVDEMLKLMDQKVNC